MILSSERIFATLALRKKCFCGIDLMSFKAVSVLDAELIENSF